MIICVNGTNQEIPNGSTLADLMELFQLKKKSIALELNRKVVDRTKFADTGLRDRDTVEIVHFVGGG